MMNRINWTELKPQIQQVGRLSLPAILTQITTIAMQYIDSAMVGALGANASAAIGLVSSTTWLLSGTIYAVGPGLSAFIRFMTEPPFIGSNARMNTRTPIPPIQWEKLLQNRLACESASTSLKMLAPVVVKPETISNSALI